MTLFDNASVSSDAAGLIVGTFGNNPSNSRNWTELSTVWTQYRVLGIKATYMPRYSVNTAAISGFTGYHSVVHGIPPTPTTPSEAASTGESRIWNPWKQFIREWRMSEIAEADFIPVSAPFSSSGALYVWANSATASILYGNIQLEYLVQFRVHAL
jgi:hypothetical protein